MMKLYTKIHFNMFILCKENEWKLLVDRQTAAKQYALPSSKGGIKSKRTTFAILDL